jgi:hypothetical protein
MYMLCYTAGVVFNRYYVVKCVCLCYVGSILEKGHNGDYVWGTGSREMDNVAPGNINITYPRQPIYN